MTMQTESIPAQAEVLDVILTLPNGMTMRAPGPYYSLWSAIDFLHRLARDQESTWTIASLFLDITKGDKYWLHLSQKDVT